MSRQGSVPGSPLLNMEEWFNYDSLVSDNYAAEVTHGAPPPAQYGPNALSDALPATPSLNYAFHAIPMLTSQPSSHSAASGTAPSSSASPFDGYHTSAAAAVASHLNTHTAANQPNFTLPSTSTAPSPAANAVSPEAPFALFNMQPGVNGAALPLVAGRSDNTTLAGAVANPAYLPSMQFASGVPLRGLPGTAFPRNELPAAASTPSPATRAVSSDAYVAASAQLTASGAGSQLSPFSSPPPQTPGLPVGANGLASPLNQLMQALEQAHALATQLAASGNAFPIPTTTPPPRALVYASVTAATLMLDETLADARNAISSVGGEDSSWSAWTVIMKDPQSKKSASSKGQRRKADAPDASVTSDDTTPFCVLRLHVLLKGPNNQPLEPTSDAIVQMRVKIELETLERPNVPTETVLNNSYAFKACPKVVLPVRFTRVLAMGENQREIRLKVTMTPVGGEPMVVGGLPSTITCRSRRTGDRKKKLRRLQVASGSRR